MPGKTLRLPRLLDDEQASGYLTRTAPAMEALPVTAPYDVVDADTGKLVCRVVSAPRNLTVGCVTAFRRVARGKVQRAAGITSASNTFGYAGPNPMMRRNVPTLSAWGQVDPEGHAALDRFAAWAWGNLQDTFPAEVVARMEEVRESLHPDWRCAGTPWTSGIANDNASLHYHRDRNNIRDSWSVMLAARAGVTGGYLHLPEYGAAFPVDDKDVLYFRGVELVHGVTPMQFDHPQGFRYTFVWYPVRNFLKRPGAQEALRAAQDRRTVVEETLLERQRKSGMLQADTRSNR